MAGYPADRLSFPDILDPVLEAPDGDDAALDRAINDVAEALADSGTLIVDALVQALEHFGGPVRERRRAG